MLSSQWCLRKAAASQRSCTGVCSGSGRFGTWCSVSVSKRAKSDVAGGDAAVGYRQLVVSRRVRLLYPIRKKFRRRCVALGLFFQLFCFFVLLLGAYRTFLSEGSPSGGLLFSLLSFSVSVFGGLDQPLFATRWSCHLFEILIPF
jgi:hypothetical protein